MIRLDIERYCHDCLEFEADVERPIKVDYIGTNKEQMTCLSDTVIRCEHRYKCKNIQQHLEREVTGND